MAFIPFPKLSIRRFALYLIIFFLASCQDKSTRKIKEFYFPLETLQESGKIYYYSHPQDETIAPYFMFYKSEQNESGFFLVSEQFDSDFNLKQQTTEEVVSNGMLMSSSNIFLRDSSNQIIKRPVEIQAGAVFPFEVRDSSTMFFYKIKWQEVGDSSYFNIITRNRIYAGDTTYTYNGKLVDCIKFDVKELVENVRDGNVEHEFNGIEIYGKDIGLVYYRKNISSDFVLEYELKSILDEQSMNLDSGDKTE